MSKESFYFKDKVGVIEDMEKPMSYKPSPRVSIEMAQNGFELHYNDKEFVASTLDEAMKMAKEWFEKVMKKQKK